MGRDVTHAFTVEPDFALLPAQPLKILSARPCWHGAASLLMVLKVTAWRQAFGAASVWSCVATACNVVRGQCVGSSGATSIAPGLGPEFKVCYARIDR